MVFVLVVQVTVVDVVDVVTVLDSFVAATWAVLVVMSLVDVAALSWDAFVPVAVMLMVEVAVVSVVDVVTVLDCSVTTVGAVLVVVLCVGYARHGIFLSSMFSFTSL